MNFRDSVAIIQTILGHTRSRRQGARTLLAGLLLGLGLVTVGSSLVQAQDASIADFFARVFGAPAPMAAPAHVIQPDRHRPRRYSALPDARRIAAPRRNYTPRPIPHVKIDLGVRARRRSVEVKRPAKSPSPAGTAQQTPTPSPNAIVRLSPGPGSQTVCVRTCDGYMFPVGHLRADADLPVHTAACAAACPGAESALFTVAQGLELDQAVSLSGQPYLAAAFAKVYQKRRVENCACHPDGVGAQMFPLAQDATLRVGDIVATETSANVITKMSRSNLVLTDYRKAPGLSRGRRLGIEARVGRMARDTREAAYQRAIGKIDAETQQRRISEASVLVLRQAEAAADPEGIDKPAPSAATGRGTRLVRYVGKSNFGDY